MINILLRYVYVFSLGLMIKLLWLINFKFVCFVIVLFDNIFVFIIDLILIFGILDLINVVNMFNCLCIIVW